MEFIVVVIVCACVCKWCWASHFRYLLIKMSIRQTHEFSAYVRRVWIEIDFGVPQYLK